VHLDQLTRQGQTYPEAAVPARARRVRLCELLEDAWQKIRPDPDAAVPDDDRRAGIAGFESDIDFSAFGSELNGV
jgi:hypothetical protein